MKPYLLFCLCLWGMQVEWCGAAFTPEQDKALDQQCVRIEKKEGKFGARGVMSFLIEAAAQSWHPERLGAAITLLEEFQDRNPESRTYGNFRWYGDQEKPVDLNAVEFVMQQAVLLWKFHRESLTKEDQERFRKMLELGIEGIRRHGVRVEYTNIYLMKTWNNIALGEALGRKDAMDEGYSMFGIWYDYTLRNGITEYVSTTYYGVDVDNLTLINRYAGREEVRKAGERILKFIWAQGRVNWFDPCQRFGGAHSRDYDYLTGHGEFDRTATLWRWPVEEKKSPLLDAMWKYTTPPPIMIEGFEKHLAIPRFVSQKWGKEPDRVATLYMGKTFCIGVAGACASPEDKFFTINFDGGPKMVMVNFFMDGRGDPYGQNRVKLRDGHTKAHHLVPFVASAQDGGDVLLFSSYSPNGDPKKENTDCIFSHLDIPIEASVWQGGREIKADSSGFALNADKPFYLRYGNTSVAIRPINATTDGGGKVSPVFFRDGEKYKASRITWVHATRKPARETHVTLWVRAMENLDAPAFGKFCSEFESETISYSFENGKLLLSVPGKNGALKLEADVIGNTKSSSTKLPAGILEVNGVEIGQPLLSNGGF